MEALRVLVVEDNPHLAELVGMSVTRAGLEVGATVATEDEALRLIDAQPFAIAVIDLQLAQGTGFGVMRALRKMRYPCAIIVFTNHAVPALKVASFEAGADYFLDKVRDAATLQRLIAELAAGKHLEPLDTPRSAA